MTLDYRCPGDGCTALLFRADGVLEQAVEIKCHGCREIVEPQPHRPLHVRVECDNCGETWRRERPKGLTPACLSCGSQRLTELAQRVVDGHTERRRTKVRAR